MQMESLFKFIRQRFQDRTNSVSCRNQRGAKEEEFGFMEILQRLSRHQMEESYLVVRLESLGIFSKSFTRHLVILSQEILRQGRFCAFVRSVWVVKGRCKCTWTSPIYLKQRSISLRRFLRFMKNSPVMILENYP